MRPTSSAAEAATTPKHTHIEFELSRQCNAVLLRQTKFTPQEVHGNLHSISHYSLFASKYDPLFVNAHPSAPCRVFLPYNDM